MSSAHRTDWPTEQRPYVSTSRTTGVIRFRLVPIHYPHPLGNDTSISADAAMVAAALAAKQ